MPNFGKDLELPFKDNKRKSRGSPIIIKTKTMVCECVYRRIGTKDDAR